MCSCVYNAKCLRIYFQIFFNETVNELSEIMLTVLEKKYSWYWVRYLNISSLTYNHISLSLCFFNAEIKAKIKIFY